MIGPAVDDALSKSLASLSTGQQRLSLISSHDALVLLRSALSHPKLNHLLRTASCSGNPILSSIDNMLLQCVSCITNTRLDEDQWLQASLPCKAGGLGIRLASQLAPSTFSATAAATRNLQSLILGDRFMDNSPCEDAARALWSSFTSAAFPVGEAASKQSHWDKPVVEAAFNRLLEKQSSAVSRARLLAVSSPHSGDWLNALPISSCGLRLDDEAIRISVGLRLGTDIGRPHQCVCGAPVDAKGTHGLSCKLSSARINRHSALNDIVHRSLIRATVPAVKEPTGLLRNDGKRPDGVTQIPWSFGKCLTWDVTVIDTLATSYVTLSSISAGKAAERAASNKVAKYSAITATHDFVPIAIETLGPINTAATDFLTSLGRRIALITGEVKETSYLFQRISICLQRYNALAVRSSLVSEIVD